MRILSFFLTMMAVLPMSGMMAAAALGPIYLTPPLVLKNYPLLSPEGDAFLLQDLPPKIRLVSLWAPWCAPCQAEMPQFAALQRALKGQDFEIIALSFEDQPIDQLKAVLERWKAPDITVYGHDQQAMAKLLVEEGLWVAKTPMGRLLSLSAWQALSSGEQQAAVRLALPTTLLVDRDNRVLLYQIGADDWNSPQNKALIERLIRQAQAEEARD